ncbi:LapA family protein [Marinilabiliaceae bacterium ANBcel2]|nr:LapA family protein [Marinilabiliaceae bacterium ANBcel2]
MMKRKIKFSFWVFIALTVLLVIFSVQNSDPVRVRIIFWPIEISLAILLIGTFITGLITGALCAYKKLLPDSNDKTGSLKESIQKAKDKLTKKDEKNPRVYHLGGAQEEDSSKQKNE